MARHAAHPPTEICEACNTLLAQTPRPRTKTKLVAWLMLLFVLGVPLIGVAILRLIYDSR